jgi:hypothetical protein
LNNDCHVYAEPLRYWKRHCVYQLDIFLRLQKHFTD